MSSKKNLHEGNILYFGLKVCKKTGTKKVKIASFFYSYQVPFIHIKMEMKETERQCYKCAEIYWRGYLLTL